MPALPGGLHCVQQMGDEIMAKNDLGKGTLPADQDRAWVLQPTATPGGQQLLDNAGITEYTYNGQISEIEPIPNTSTSHLWVGNHGRVRESN
jgi:hypothetical protein